MNTWHLPSAKTRTTSVLLDRLQVRHAVVMFEPFQLVRQERSGASTDSVLVVHFEYVRAAKVKRLVNRLREFQNKVDRGHMDLVGDLNQSAELVLKGVLYVSKEPLDTRAHVLKRQLISAFCTITAEVFS
jgi:hypothetical protein